MGFIEDRAMLGDGGQYNFGIVCQKLGLTLAVSITRGVTPLQMP
jgi:hypothetical protein